jgi:hypothetical protein
MGMGISGVDFTALVADLMDVLDVQSGGKEKGEC